ncbi:MAG: helix-turn-helix domain-containing protein [Desulfitobacteriia bacterium]
MVAEKAFRDDLFFRLAVMKLNLPALRERPTDILPLAEYFVQDYSKKMNLKTPKISPASREIMLNYHWPGNVRQLENAMIFAVNMVQGEMIEPECLPNELFELEENSFPYKKYPVNKPGSFASYDVPLSFKDSEILVIQKALTKTSGNVSAAARLLNISRASLYKKIKDYNIERN